MPRTEIWPAPQTDRGGIAWMASRSRRRVAASRRVLCGLIVFVAACAAPPDRPTPVGRLSRDFADTARLDWSGIGPRPLATTVWYPAAAGSLETDWAAGIFRFGRGARDAAFVDRQPRPLIVLSHGTGGSAAQLSWLAEALAAQGFVVAGVHHHGNTAAESHAQPAGFVLPWERALDLSVLIDLLAADPVIGPQVDTTRVGAAGFSLGGYTVLALAGARLPGVTAWRHRCESDRESPECQLPPEATFTLADVDSLARMDAQFQAGVARGNRPTRDPRVRVVLAMAPALIPLLDTSAPPDSATAVHVILGGLDTQVPPGPIAPALAHLVPHAVVETLPGVSHYAFLAPCTWRGRLLARALCADGGPGRVALHARVAQVATEHFTRSLGRESVE